MTNRSERYTRKLTRYVAVTRCSRVLYCSVTPRTSTSGSAPSAPIAAMQIGQVQVLPTRGLHLDATDPVHELRGDERLVRRERELHLRVGQLLHQLRLGLGRVAHPLVDLRGRGRILVDRLGRFLERADERAVRLRIVAVELARRPH